jgi:acyl dehydratase
MGLEARGLRASFDERDTMLYALSIGMGSDPLDARELPFVVEQLGLRTVPTMASVLFASRLLHDCGLNYAMFVHGEQSIRLHAALPTRGELVADAKVVDVYDKGTGKGAVVVQQISVRDANSAALLYTARSATFARGDGGLGGPVIAAPQPHALPQRDPDVSVEFQTQPNQALWYRLNGDRNPLHADPQAAKRAGFDAPILHGLCTYGIACRAVIQAVCDYDAARITGFDVRFSAPVFPGERVVTEIWRDGSIVSFRCRVPGRQAIVINNGKCTLDA